MTKVVGVSANKGGSLKTSISVNLAGTLATHGKKVLCIDMDNQGNLATSFGIDPDNVEFSIYDLLVKSPEVTNLKEAILRVHDNIDIIVANDDMAYFELDILTNTDKFPHYFNLLKDVVDKVKTGYDFVIIDTPPQMGLISANTFNACEDIIIPFQPEEFAFRSLVKTVNAVNQFKSTNSKLNIKDIVPVKVRRTILHNAFLDSAKSYAKTQQLPFSSVYIRESIKYSETSARLNIPVTLLEELPKSIVPYKDVYTKIAKEVGYIG